MARDEYELGEAVEVERRPRADVVVSVRLSREEAEQLQELAQRRGVTLSRIAREAITSYIDTGGTSRWSAVQWTGTTADGTTADVNNLDLTVMQQSSIVVTRGEVHRGQPISQPGAQKGPALLK